MEQIPYEWDIVKLIELCDERPQYGAAVAALPSDESLPRYIRITDIKDDGTLNDDVVSISEDDAKPFLLAKGDFLFARTGATVGKTYLYRDKHGRCAFAGYLIRFKSNEQKLNAEFLFHYCHSANYWRWLRSFFTHGVQPNVNAEQYSNLLIIRPTIKEQQKIASILSKLDGLIHKTDEIIKQTQRLKVGIMQRYFSKNILEKNRAASDVVRLGDYIYVKGRIGWRGLKSDEYLEEGPYMISGYNLLGKTIDWKNCLHIGRFRYEESPEIQLKPNDIVMVKDGVTLGRLGFIDQMPREATINSTLVLIRELSGMFVPKYLYYYFQSEYFQNKIMSNVAGLAVPHIFQRDINNLKIWKLPRIEQQKIAGILSSIDAEVDILQRKKSSTFTLKKSVMEKLLTGQIRVKV